MIRRAALGAVGIVAVLATARPWRCPEMFLGVGSARCEQRLSHDGDHVVTIEGGVWRWRRVA